MAIETSSLIDSSLVAAVVGVVGILLGVLIGHLVTKEREKRRKAIALFEKWHSEQMIGYRTIAWSYLTQEYPNQPVPFFEMFTNPSYCDNGAAKPHVAAVSQIAYFWYQFVLLRQKGEIAKDSLTEQLFCHQYNYWYKALEPIHRENIKSGEFLPDWKLIFEVPIAGWLSAIKELPLPDSPRSKDGQEIAGRSSRR